MYDDDVDDNGNGDDDDDDDSDGDSDAECYYDNDGYDDYGIVENDIGTGNRGGIAMVMLVLVSLLLLSWQRLMLLLY